MNNLAQWETDWQMKFNVVKCHSMRVTRHPPDKQIHFDSINKNWNIFSLPNTYEDLDWGQHISEIACKATKTLGFLQRNLASAHRHTKEVANKTLVHPQLEYAAPIWHPCHDIQTGQMEKVQEQLPDGPAGNGET